MSPDSASILERDLVRLGLNASDIRESLSIYLRELERWNKKLNLTSLEGEELVRRLISEPAWIGQQLQMSGVLADIGSGNGSPGLPLYVTCRLNGVHLIEARSRRAAFLRHVASLLGSEGILVHKSRAEEIREFTPRADWICMQAVSPTRKLLDALRALCPSTTRVVWITSVMTPAPVAHAERLNVANSNTVAWIFHLDQF